MRYLLKEKVISLILFAVQGCVGFVCGLFYLSLSEEAFFPLDGLRKTVVFVGTCITIAIYHCVWVWGSKKGY